MRGHILATAGAALLGGAVLAGCGGGDDADDVSGLAGTGPDAQPAAQREGVTPQLREDVADMRTGTAAYVTDPSAAEDDGYLPMTQLVEGAGYHFLNLTAPEKFDPGEPSMLVYTGNDEDAQLAAVGWAFTDEPLTPPLDGATYGSFPAACHYADGSYVEGADETECAETNPKTEAQFAFWHPDLTTLYVWAWMPNPNGLFSPTNPLLSSSTEPTATSTAAPAGTPSPTPGEE